MQPILTLFEGELYEEPTLLKVTMHIIKCDPFKIFLSHCYMWALLWDFRPFTWNVTLLEDLTMIIRSNLKDFIYTNTIIRKQQ